MPVDMKIETLTTGGVEVQRGKPKPIVVHDFNVCPEQDDGRHGPLEADADWAIASTHVSVRCVSCGLTTGWPIDEFEGRLDWN